jgi:hypothetical protein
MPVPRTGQYRGVHGTGTTCTHSLIEGNAYISLNSKFRNVWQVVNSRNYSNISWVLPDKFCGDVHSFSRGLSSKQFAIANCVLELIIPKKIPLKLETLVNSLIAT